MKTNLKPKVWRDLFALTLIIIMLITVIEVNRQSEQQINALDTKLDILDEKLKEIVESGSLDPCIANIRKCFEDSDCVRVQDHPCGCGMAINKLFVEEWQEKFDLRSRIESIRPIATHTTRSASFIDMTRILLAQTILPFLMR